MVMVVMVVMVMVVVMACMRRQAITSSFLVLEPESDASVP
jgi:hypothetical protein